MNWREQQRKTKGRKQTDVVWESAKCGTADNFAQQAEESMGINLWEKSLGPGETIPGCSIVFPGRVRVPEASECDGGCTGCVRLPLQPLLAEGCSLQFALSGYVVNGTSSFLRLPYGLTQGSCVQGLLPMVSFGCCICCLCQAVAAQERDPVGVSVGGYGVAKLLGCSVPCALSLAPPKFCYGSRCSYGPYPGAFCQVWAGESHPDDVDGSRCTA